MRVWRNLAVFAATLTAAFTAGHYQVGFWPEIAAITVSGWITYALVRLVQRRLDPDRVL